MGIARAIGDMAERGRAGQLRPDEMQGGTYTLTNYGSNGTLMASPIINPPQCAILGLGKIERRPVVRLLDGKAYWPYGIEQLMETCARSGATLTILPRNNQPNPKLLALSTVTPQNYQHL